MASSDPRSTVTSTALTVSPDLLGLPLARPSRRLAAMTVDLALLAIISRAGAIALGFAMAAGLWRLARIRSDRRSFDNIRRGTLGSLSAVVLLVSAVMLFRGVVSWADRDDSEQFGPLSSPETVQLMLSEIVEAVNAVAELPGDVTPPGDAAAADPDAAPLRARLEALETHARQLADATEAERNRFQSFVARFANNLGLVFGWGTIYFSVFGAWWNGQTPGKRLLGIRVIRLTGRPMTGWTSFQRAGGYAAGFATGLLGFARILWDRNRQALHDRMVSTVVVRERRA